MLPEPPPRSQRQKSPKTPLFACFILSPLSQNLIRQMEGTVTLIDMVSKQFTMNWSLVLESTLA